jgi:creatinine amidohydrolase
MKVGCSRVMVRCLFPFVLGLTLAGFVCADTGKALVLQEMSWPEVEAYLKTGDMVIIPLGSTEQHGPHLPLGTDFFEALETCKKISARTGVVVAPVVMAGYSIYHSGFPGTLSLKPETLAQVLVETMEVLQRYGFRRFMLYNYHGGNHLAQAMAIHRINHTTGAIAVAVGDGGELPLKSPAPDKQVDDYHAGVDETSMMLFLRPDLVRMDRAEKPVLTFSPEMKALMTASGGHPELGILSPGLQAVPKETGKGGSLREISSNGVWTDADPRDATAELGEQIVNRYVESVVAFIETWKLATASPASSAE